ncbi:MAG TPA: type II toxin-antitoxin system RelE/ParE family toxin [Nitrospirae bacterium]|nr:type II toxin-antitoxin system RelE/ParE family toxin [Nitrospirota bacterium]HDO22366.1 type II toxin-antitoxin system RelE/ParE family toxin [Nitrospirota bacterium]
MNIRFKAVWSESAYRDIANIIEYIAEDSPANARKILTRIKKTVSDLYHSPQRGRFVPELQDQGILLYRELVIPPWRVMYRVSENTVLVLSVIDSRQNIEDILLKKLMNM